MFIAALVTIAKVWKQPKCLSVDEWIKKLWCIYTMEYYMAIKKEILLLCNSTDGPVGYYIAIHFCLYCNDNISQLLPAAPDKDSIECS